MVIFDINVIINIQVTLPVGTFSVMFFEAAARMYIWRGDFKVLTFVVQPLSQTNY